MGRKIIFFMINFLLFFVSFSRETEVEIGVELEVIKSLEINASELNFGGIIAGETNVKKRSDLLIRGESGENVTVKLFDQTNLANEGFLDLNKDGDSTKKQRVNLEIVGSTNGVFTLVEVGNNLKIEGTMTQVTNEAGTYRGMAVVRVTYN